MRRSHRHVAVLVVSVMVLSGCAWALAPVTGGLVTTTKAPWTATSNADYSKKGTAECHSVLGLFGFGDASISTAMAKGGITKIHHVDFESVSFLGIYARFTIIVYGE